MSIQLKPITSSAFHCTQQTRFPTEHLVLDTSYFEEAFKEAPSEDKDDSPAAAAAAKQDPNQPSKEEEEEEEEKQ